MQPASDIDRREVLNALRHQRKNHACAVAADLTNAWCSTPYGIKGRITRVRRAPWIADLNVLNALRHQRKNHAASNHRQPAHRCAQRLTASKEESPRRRRARRVQACVCSTPYGIKGRITPALSARVRRSSSAQRLTASTEESRGIASDRGQVRLVLNALRHQRKNHSTAMRGHAQLSTCAQRLTASKEESPAYDRLGSSHGVMCAQRLTASTEESRGCRLERCRRSAVLNALRHQRKNHRRRERLVGGCG